MLWLEHKYVNLLSPRLPLFRKKNARLYNCRCPLCGDSKKDKFKTRGFIVEKTSSLLYFCHNCGASMPFGKFLSIVDHQLHEQYVKEKFIESHQHTEQLRPLEDIKTDVTKIFKPKYAADAALAGLKKISQLPATHPAKGYVVKRKIPANTHYKLYYAPKFKAWVNSLVPDKFKPENDEPRLILPLIDRFGKLIGFQGRSFKKDAKLRYITIMLDETAPKVFGLDTLKSGQRVYLVEGPIDSLFLPNALAMAGSDLSLSSDIADPSNTTVVFDNEPRNKEIVEKIEKYVEKGYDVCIWPSHIEQKDINDMVCSGLTSHEVKLIIDNNTFSGLRAKLQLSVWKRI